MPLAISSDPQGGFLIWTGKHRVSFLQCQISQLVMFTSLVWGMPAVIDHVPVENPEVSLINVSYCQDFPLPSEMLPRLELLPIMLSSPQRKQQGILPLERIVGWIHHFCRWKPRRWYNHIFCCNKIRFVGTSTMLIIILCFRKKKVFHSLSLHNSVFINPQHHQASLGFALWRGEVL